MKRDVKINVEHITRVEGHGNIVIDIKNGRIKELRLEIVESPRFYEAMVMGRRYEDVPHIVSRICGICAVSHTSASLKAIESALGIHISSQALDLRKLAFYGEIIQSHILHLYFLVLPDLFGVGSIMPLISSHPDIVKRGMRLKKLADDICRIVVGRHIHPISLTTGGITHLPDIGELKELKNLLKDSTKDLDATLGLFKTFPIPQFSKKREFISLKEDGQYAYYSGNIYSSKRYCIKPKDYKKVIKEYIVPYSTAKHVQGKKGVYMVGAMARVNNNFKQLSKRAREAAKEIGLTLQPYNPFMNNASQLVEVYHCIEDSKKIIDRLISNGLKKEDLKRPKKFGKGVGIVEAPRGMLVHEYTIDKNGIITDANCIIPTAQNLKIMEDDVRNYVPTILGKTKEEITRDIETLVRAYDPCISCSTHIMDVRFDE